MSTDIPSIKTRMNRPCSICAAYNPDRCLFGYDEYIPNQRDEKTEGCKCNFTFPELRKVIFHYLPQDPDMGFSNVITRSSLKYLDSLEDGELKDLAVDIRNKNICYCMTHIEDEISSSKENEISQVISGGFTDKQISLLNSLSDK